MSDSKTPKGLAWHGGKHRLARWIVPRLPMRSIYCEPFAGMLSVLLRRPPARYELANDANGDVVNWWRQVRENPKAMRHLTYNTPKSRVEYERCCELMRTRGWKDDLERAWAFHVAVDQSLMKGVEYDGAWALAFAHSDGSSIQPRWRRDEDWFAPLSKRIRRLQLENACALEVLDRMKGREDATLYCDPPYADTENDPYGAHGTLDRGALEALLKAQRGAVAISGYPGEWDALDWRMESKDIVRASTGKSSKMTRRTECLWMNYPASKMGQGDMF